MTQTAMKQMMIVLALSAMTCCKGALAVADVIPKPALIVKVERCWKTLSGYKRFLSLIKEEATSAPLSKEKQTEMEGFQNGFVDCENLIKEPSVDPKAPNSPSSSPPAGPGPSLADQTAPSPNRTEASPNPMGASPNPTPPDPTSLASNSKAPSAASPSQKAASPSQKAAPPSQKAAPPSQKATSPRQKVPSPIQKASSPNQLDI